MSVVSFFLIVCLSSLLGCASGRGVKGFALEAVTSLLRGEGATLEWDRYRPNCTGVFSVRGREGLVNAAVGAQIFTLYLKIINDNS